MARLVTESEYETLQKIRNLLKETDSDQFGYLEDLEDIGGVTVSQHFAIQYTKEHAKILQSVVRILREHDEEVKLHH